MSYLLAYASEEPPPVGDYTVSETHPRLFLTPTILSELQSERTSYGGALSPWANLQGRANQNATFAHDSYGSFYPSTVGLEYQISGSTANVSKALTWMDACCQDSHPMITSNRYYHDDALVYRSSYLDIALAYDWLWPLLSSARKTQYAKWLMDNADLCWPDSNPNSWRQPPSGGNIWGVGNPNSNYFWAFLNTWIAALACYYEDTGTGTISGSDRPAYHLALAKSKFSALTAVALASTWQDGEDGWLKGGDVAEGNGYAEAPCALPKLLAAHYTATGEDLLNDGGVVQAWCDAQAKLFVTAMVGDKTQQYSIGDMIKPYYGQQPRRGGVWLSYWPTSASTRGYMQKWLNEMKFYHNGETTTGHISNDWFLWEEMLNFRHTASESDYTATLPPYYYADGGGLMIVRGGWGATDTLSGIFCGPMSESHMDGFPPHEFQIWKKDWLIANAALWGWSSLTVGHGSQSVIEVGTTPDYHLVLQNSATTAPEDTAQLLKKDNGTDYHVAEIQARYSYKDGANVPVSDAVRKWVAIPGSDLWVIVDRMTLQSPATASMSKEWHAVSRNDWTVAGMRGSVASVEGTYKAVVDCLYPTTGVTLSSSAIGGGWGDSTLAIDAADATKVTDAGWPFAAGDARGTTIIITAGTGFTPGTYTIQSVSSGVATLDRACGTTGSTGGTFTYRSGFRLNVSVAKNQLTDYIVNVVHAAAAAATPATGTLVTDTGSQFYGVDVDGWVVLCGRSEAPTLPTYTCSTAEAKHVITDLGVSTAYSVACKNSGGTTLRTLSVTSSAGGVLRFDAAANEVQFVVSAA